MDGSPDDDPVKCAHCSYKGPLSSFPPKIRGRGRVQTCSACTVKSNSKNAKKRARQKANEENDAVPTSQAALSLPINPSQGLGVREAVPWATLAAHLALARTGPCRMDTILTLEPNDPAANAEDERKKRARLIANEIRKATGCRFKYVLLWHPRRNGTHLPHIVYTNE